MIHLRTTSALALALSLCALACGDGAKTAPSASAGPAPGTASFEAIVARLGKVQALVKSGTPDAPTSCAAAGSGPVPAIGAKLLDAIVEGREGMPKDLSPGFVGSDVFATVFSAALLKKQGAAAKNVEQSLSFLDKKRDATALAETSPLLVVVVPIDYVAPKVGDVASVEVKTVATSSASTSASASAAPASGSAAPASGSAAPASGSAAPASGSAAPAVGSAAAPTIEEHKRAFEPGSYRGRLLVVEVAGPKVLCGVELEAKSSEHVSTSTNKGEDRSKALASEAVVDLQKNVWSAADAALGKLLAGRTLAK